MCHDYSNSQNPYGLLPKFNEQTEIVTDERFAYVNKTIQLGSSTRKLWTKKDGLSRIYLYGDGDVDSNDGDLSDSGGVGRVVAFRDGVAVTAQNVEWDLLKRKYISDLRDLRRRIDSELSSISERD